MPKNPERIEIFATHYATALAAEIAKHPDDYAYGPERAPEVAAKMANGLATGSANLGPAGKRAARALGIKPTQRDIRAWLCDAAPLATSTPDAAPAPAFVVVACGEAVTRNDRDELSTGGILGAPVSSENVYISGYPVCDRAPASLAVDERTRAEYRLSGTHGTYEIVRVR